MLENIGYLPKPINKKIKEKISEYLCDESYDFDCDLNITNDVKDVVEGWGVVINDNDSQFITFKNDYKYIEKKDLLYIIMKKERDKFFKDIGLPFCKKKLLSLTIPSEFAEIIFEGIKV